MLRRHAALAFAAGMHVFPGGVVDPSDAEPSGTEPSGTEPSGTEPERALLNAAVRETFEETGVLLAEPSSGRASADEAELKAELEAELEAERLALIAHRTSLADVLARHLLAVSIGRLRSWSHWVTPEFEPRRYDTRFFVAELPAGQQPREVGGESDSSNWVTPVAALAAQAAGEWLLLPPTEVTLRELSAYSSAAQAFAAAVGRDVRPIRASIDLDADPPVFVLDSSSAGPGSPA